MTRRVRASAHTRKRLEELFSGQGGEKSDLVKLAAQLIVEEALEAEVDDALEHGYYEPGARLGHRNGYRRGRLKTAEGAIEYAVPQVRDTLQPYRSEVREALAEGRTEEPERLAVEMYARGLSVRDIEAAFTDGAGCCVLSRSAVSELTERLWADYQAFATRDLKARGLCDAVLMVSAGAPGLIRAIEEVCGRSLRQRCLAHKIRNLEAKVPAERWREVKGHALAAYQAPSPMLARDEFVRRYERELPSATACFLDDFEACIAHLRLPIAHRRAIRTTNLLERLFGEERRRTKVIPHAFG